MIDHRKKKAAYYQAIQRSRTSGAALRIACGKLCHESKSKAKSAIRRLAGSGKAKDAGRLNPYHCTLCSAWHIGHLNTREDRNVL